MKIIKYFFESIIIYIFFLIIKIIGLNNSRILFSFIFRIVGPIIKSKKVIKENIYTVFGKNIDKKKIIKDMWSNYGKVFAEYIYLKRFKKGSLKKKHIYIKGTKLLEEIIKKKKPVIFISGHFANFELMSMELVKKEINLATIYRPLNNIFLNPLMEYLRMKYTCPVMVAKGRVGTRKIINHIKNGYSVALAADQRVGEGPKIPFFKKPASTTTIPAQLAIKYNCKLVPVHIERKNNISFEMTVYEPYEVNKTGDDEKDKLNITYKINEVIEKMIKKNPGQWPWSHNRWK